MKTLLFLSKTNKTNALFVVMLFCTLSLTTSCYQDDDNSGVLQRLSIDNVQKLATRNFEIYKFSDSIMSVYRKIQYEYPYNEVTLTLSLSTGKRKSATKVMDSLVYLLDSINTHALHRYTKNKEAYDYSQRTSTLPKGYVVDEKFTLEYLDTVYLNLSKLLNYHLPSIKKEAANFSDAAYRKLSLWYLELEQYLAKVKTLNTQFAETITPNKFTTKISWKISNSTTVNKTVYDFLLPFQRDSIKKVSDIESDMFAVDFYLRNQSFLLGKDTTKILKVTKRLTSQADNFMFVVKFCPTLLQYEEYKAKGDTIYKDIVKLEKLIKANFPNMLIGGKNAVIEIGSAINKFTTETIYSNDQNYQSLVAAIIKADTANFMNSGNIVNVISLPNDYAEQKLKVLSDLKTQAEKQIEIEITKSKDWIKARVDLLGKLIIEEEKLRNQIMSTPYQSQTTPIIMSQTPVIYITQYFKNIVDSLNNRIKTQKALKTELTNYYQCATCEPKNLAKTISIGAIDTLTQQLKGAEVTFEMAWLLDSVSIYYTNVTQRIAAIGTPSTTIDVNIKRKLENVQTKLPTYATSLRASIEDYYDNTPQLYYDGPKPIFNEFSDIRKLLKDVDEPTNQVIAFDPATVLNETGNPRKFIYNVSTLSNGKKEMLAINKGTDSNLSLNFISIPISHLSETTPTLTNQTVSNVISSLNDIEVEIGDIGTNNIGINNFAVCLNTTLIDGHLIQIPLLPTTNNKYVLVSLGDNVNNDHHSFWDNAYRDYPNVQRSGSYLAYKGTEVLNYLTQLTSPVKNVKISIYHKSYWDDSDANYGKNVQSIKIRGIFN